MKTLNLPPFDFRINTEEQTIFDPQRKKYVALLPEEWVRQHFVQYMINQLGYPSGLIKVEFGIKYNHLSKRPDVLCFDRSGEPLLLVECKSFDIQITKKVFEQAAVYNKVLQCPYAVVTNGLQHFCWQQNTQTGLTQFLNAIPEFESLMN